MNNIMAKMANMNVNRHAITAGRKSFGDLRYEYRYNEQKCIVVVEFDYLKLL